MSVVTAQASEAWSIIILIHVENPYPLVSNGSWWEEGDLILYVPVNNISAMSGQVFLGWTSTKQGLMRLAQGHNAVTAVRLEPAALLSQVKHSITEPLPLRRGRSKPDMLHALEQHVSQPAWGCLSRENAIEVAELGGHPSMLPPTNTSLISLPSAVNCCPGSSKLRVWAKWILITLPFMCTHESSHQRRLDFYRLLQDRRHRGPFQASSVDPDSR